MLDLDTTDSQDHVNVITTDQGKNALLNADAICYTDKMTRNWTLGDIAECKNTNSLSLQTAIDASSNKYELSNGSFVIENITISDSKICFLCSISCGSIHAILKYRLNVTCKYDTTGIQYLYINL